MPLSALAFDKQQQECMFNLVERWRQKDLFQYLGQHFLDSFWVQEKTNDPGKLQEELGFLEELGA